MTSPLHLPEPARRLLSLDVVRGITIAFMIMVNNNGGSGSWRFMNHAEWNGLTATDLVFPTFVFVMGVSVVFAIEARLARGATRGQLVRHTVQRAVILCVLGIVVNSFPFFELDHMRFYGVLQRIAVCYLAVSLFYLWDRRAWPIAAALVVALVGYWYWCAGFQSLGPACQAATYRSWTCARTWCRGSIASCSPITCTATCRTTTCAIRKAC